MNEIDNIEIEKLVHGGQGLASLPDGRKVMVWGVLPGETVRITLTKSKKSYAEAIANKIIKPSIYRIEPAEENYLATSPWQIMTLDYENEWKKNIVAEIFEYTKVKLPKHQIISDGKEFGYRNKMEYSFWGDDSGVHLALYSRGTHKKHIVQGSMLAISSINDTSQALLQQLNKLKIRASDLKTIIVRSSQNGEVVISLFVKLTDFPKLKLPIHIRGLKVYYSNPKSPASVRTELLQELGNCTLFDKLLDHEFVYDADSFFQVNVPVFESTLQAIKNHIKNEEIIDMYSGVGSIGLSIAKKSVDLVELDDATANMAELNAKASGIKASVTRTSTEKTLDYIVKDKAIIFDPPRAGLHKDIIEKILEVTPETIIYLSCNPTTQARDLELINSKYKVKFFEIYNYFPRTPHIETLAVLNLRKITNLEAKLDSVGYRFE